MRGLKLYRGLFQMLGQANKVLDVGCCEGRLAIFKVDIDSPAIVEQRINVTDLEDVSKDVLEKPSGSKRMGKNMRAQLTRIMEYD